MDMLGQLVTTQVKDADVVAISKVDVVEESAVADTEVKIRDLNPQAKLLRLSSFTGEGLDEVIESIVGWKE